MSDDLSQAHLLAEQEAAAEVAEYESEHGLPPARGGHYRGTPLRLYPCALCGHPLVAPTWRQDRDGGRAPYCPEHVPPCDACDGGWIARERRTCLCAAGLELWRRLDAGPGGVS